MKSQKLKIEIRNYWTGSVLFEYEKENNTIKDTLIEAIKANADLRYADLRYANLRYADLTSANLTSADLTSANLTSADLTSANLRSADLTYADLTYAEIDAWWHVHHEVLWEVLTERIANRINYIKSEKPKDEIKLRLKLMKPVLGNIPTSQSAWNKLHKEECGCGWNGKTIFTKKNGLVK